jgi:hypothetical protein
VLLRQLSFGLIRFSCHIHIAKGTFCELTHDKTSGSTSVNNNLVLYTATTVRRAPLTHCGRVNFVSCETSGYHCSLNEGSRFLECDPVSLGDWLPTFRRIWMPSSSRIKLAKNCWAVETKHFIISFHTPRTNHPMTRRHIPEDLTPQRCHFLDSIACSSLPSSHRCFLIKSSIAMTVGIVPCCSSLQAGLNPYRLVNCGLRFGKCDDCVDSRRLRNEKL